MSDPAYDAYLDRFDATVGPLPVGAYGKHRGHLVCKLTPEAFAEKDAEHRALEAHFFRSLERGDTINDALTKVLKEREVELILPTVF